jgi:hypothetical protein
VAGAFYKALAEVRESGTSDQSSRSLDYLLVRPAPLGPCANPSNPACSTSSIDNEAGSPCPAFPEVVAPVKRIILLVAMAAVMAAVVLANALPAIADLNALYRNCKSVSGSPTREVIPNPGPPSLIGPGLLGA